MAKKGSSKRPAGGKSSKPSAKGKSSRSASKPAVKKSTKPTAAAKKKSPAAKATAPARKAAAPAKPAAKSIAAPAKKGRDSKTNAAKSAPPAFVPPIQRPVATNDKPRKNQAGFGSRDLEHFRGILLEKRREIVGDMSSMEREALRNSGGSNLSNLPIHMADMGTDNYEQEFTLGLVEKDRVLLREINHALAKIQDGSFGICEGTGKSITKVRLEAQPWTRYSIEYARQKERGMVR